MSQQTVRTQRLPDAWFDRDQYVPRRATERGSRWFLRDGWPSLVDRLPSEACRQEVPADLAVDPVARRDAVRRTYESWRLPTKPAALRSLDALGEGSTLCVVTGQQPGFLTGPLYTVYKALTAVALARHVEAARGVRCVPVFWVASEDHDVDEVRVARWPAPGGGEESFRLPHPPGRRPLGSLEVDDATMDEVARAADRLAGRRHGEEVARLLELYRGRTVASGFAAIIAELLGDEGLVVVSPENLRPLVAPLFRRVVERPADLMDAVAEGARAVEGLGLRPFVRPRFPLFLLVEGERHHLTLDAGGLRIDGREANPDPGELRRIATERPELLSTGALLRPVAQELALPAVATVGGPAEAGYFAQLPPIFRLFGLAPPRVWPRLQATILDGGAVRAWRKLDLALDGLATARAVEDLVPLPAGATGLVEEVAGAGRVVEGLLGRIASTEEVPESGRKRVEKAVRKVASEIERLQRRVETEVRRGREELSGAAEAIWRQVFPDGGLQERRWNVFHYLAKYGRQWLGELLEEMTRQPPGVEHRLLTFETDEP